MRAAGIYLIENTVNAKFYIGSSVDMAPRWNQHRSALERGCHKNPRLQNAWNKYGSAAFVMKPLMVCDQKDILFYEQRCIDSFDAVNSGYNLSPIAGNTLGRKLSAEACANISASKRGIKKTLKARLAHSAAMASPEVRARISAGTKGLKRRPRSDAHRAALSSSQIGKKVSDETKAKLAAANLGKKKGPHSEETKRKIGLAHKGRKHSPEHILKLRAAWVRRRARNKSLTQELPCCC